MAICLGTRMENGSAPTIGEALLDAGLGTIGEYMTRYHNSLDQKIATNMILDILVAEEMHPGSPETMRWW